MNDKILNIDEIFAMMRRRIEQLNGTKDPRELSEQMVLGAAYRIVGDFTMPQTPIVITTKPNTPAIPNDTVFRKKDR